MKWGDKAEWEPGFVAGDLSNSYLLCATCFSMQALGTLNPTVFYCNHSQWTFCVSDASSSTPTFRPIWSLNTTSSACRVSSRSCAGTDDPPDASPCTSLTSLSDESLSEAATSVSGLHHLPTLLPYLFLGTFWTASPYLEIWREHRVCFGFVQIRTLYQSPPPLRSLNRYRWDAGHSSHLYHY